MFAKETVPRLPVEREIILFEEAQAIVDRLLAGRHIETERLPILHCHGHVTAEEPKSRLELPPFNKSAMDGYAVMNDDERETYRVLEHIPAGKTPTLALTPGTASRVMTGAPVPEGTDRVIMIEQTDGGEETVRVHKHGGKENICWQGEDVGVGQRLLNRGERLDVLAVANLIACGVTEVSVRRSIRLAILSTGDEITGQPGDLAPGKIMDSNGPMLAGLCKEQGIQVVRQEIVRDDREALAAALRQASESADLTVVSGGVSAGDFDFVPQALADVGFTIHFDRVAAQPGKPLTFATNGDAVLFGLPGNPVSVFTGFHLFVLRAACHLCGATPSDPGFQVPLRNAFKRKRAKRIAFIPAIVGVDGLAEPIPYHGSAHLLALSKADGFLQIPLGVDRIPEGARVLFRPLMLNKIWGRHTASPDCQPIDC